MKKFTVCVLALAALVGFASCDDDKTENPATVTISVAPKTLTLSLADSSPKKVVVTTDASSWTAVPDNEWVKVERVGGGDFNVSIADGLNEDRTTKIVVTAAEGPTAEVAVTQVKTDDPTPPETTVRIYLMPEDLLNEIFDGQISGVSSNGAYAVGHNSDYDKGFIWTKATGQYALITGSTDDDCAAYAVSDDGTVVGTFKDSNKKMVPGYWKNGTWTALPMLDGVGFYTDNGAAVTVSPDGGTITGYINMMSYRDEVGKEVTVSRPVVWVNGVIQDNLSGDALPDANLQQSGYWVWGASDDGSVIGGVADFTTGTRSPAVWVNGTMTRLYGKEDIDPTVSQDFFDGMVSGVSRNGRYAVGYFSQAGDYSDAFSFVYDTQSGTLEEITEWSVLSAVLDDGTVFGMDMQFGNGVIRTADFKGMLTDYLVERGLDASSEGIPAVIFASTADCSVMGGYFIEVYDFGPVSTPTLVVIE